MGTIKTRLIDTDIISNILKTLPKGTIKYEINELENFRIVTSNVVEKEVQILLRKIENGDACGLRDKNDLTEETVSLWKQFKSVIEIKESIVDPSQLKNVGERSLVNLLKRTDSKSRIVSNNRDHVLKILKEEGVNGNFLQTPFEFYEELGREWFRSRSETILFMIFANHDFRIVDKEYSGNILRYVH